jgi:leucine-rich repeat protein SHOC2
MGDYLVTVKYYDSDDHVEYDHLNIRRYPNYINIERLECSYNDLPNLMQNLDFLENLKELYCMDNMLKKIPIALGALKNLRVLNLCANPSLGKIPSFFQNFKKLEVLNLQQTGIKILPPFLTTLNNLKELDLSYTEITNINLLTNMKSIEKLNLHFSKVIELPEDIDNMENLSELNLSETAIVSIPKSFGNLHNLKSLQIFNTISEDCNFGDVTGEEMKIEYMDIGTSDSHVNFAKGLTNLFDLKINVNSSDVSLPTIINFDTDFQSLKDLHIESMNVLENISEVHKLKNLENLTLVGCIREIPEDFFTMTHLKSLKIYCCNVTTLPEAICDMENLEELVLENTDIKFLPDYIKNAKFITKGV